MRTRCWLLLPTAYWCLQLEAVSLLLLVLLLLMMEKLSSAQYYYRSCIRISHLDPNFFLFYFISICIDDLTPNGLLIFLQLFFLSRVTESSKICKKRPAHRFIGLLFVIWNMNSNQPTKKQPSNAIRTSSDLSKCIFLDNLISSHW